MPFIFVLIDDFSLANLSKLLSSLDFLTFFTLLLLFSYIIYSVFLGNLHNNWFYPDCSSPIFLLIKFYGLYKLLLLYLFKFVLECLLLCPLIRDKFILIWSSLLKGHTVLSLS